MSSVWHIITTQCRILLFELGGGIQRKFPGNVIWKVIPNILVKVSQEKEVEKNVSVTLNIICEGTEAKEDLTFFEEAREVNVSKS